MHPPSPERRVAREALLFSVVLLAVLLGLHRAAAFEGGLLVPLDLLARYQPWQTTLAEEATRPQNPALSDQVTLHPWTPLAAMRLVHEGEMTLWNPYQGCGSPLHANTLSAQLYPLMWLHALLPRHAALLAISVLKGLVAGLFLFLLCRRWGLSRPASWLAGLGFPLSGFMLLWLGHQHIAVASLLPLLLWISDRAAARPSLGNLAGVGLVSGASLHAGHMETALHLLLIAISYTALRALSIDGGAFRRLLRLTQLGLAYLLGAAISLVQVIPFAEYTLYSAIIHNRKNPLYRYHNAWRDLDGWMDWALGALSIVLLVAAIGGCSRAARRLRGEADGSALKPALLAITSSVLAFWIAFSLGLLDLLTLLVDPDYMGSPMAGRGNGGYAGYFLYLEMATGYASAAALLLALFGLTMRKKGDRITVYLAVAVLLSLMVVFEWPVIAQLVSQAPVLAESKNKRLLLVVCLGVLLLAAKGLDHMKAAAGRRDRRAFLAPLIALLTIVSGAVVGRTIAGPESPSGTPTVPVAEVTPISLIQSTLAVSPSPPGGYLGAVRGAEDRTAHREDRLRLSGYVFGRAIPDQVRILLAGGDESRDYTCEVSLDIQPDVQQALALLGEGWSAGEFAVDVDLNDLPAGVYRQIPVLQTAGTRVGELPASSLHIARPMFHQDRALAFAVAALLLVLIALFPMLATAGAWLLALLVVADLFLAGDGFNPAVSPKYDFPETEGIAWLKEHTTTGQDRVWADPPVTLLPANTATAFRLRDLRMYDSIDLLHYTTFLTPLVVSGAEGATRAKLNAGARMFDLTAARYILSAPGSSPPAPHFNPVYTGEMTIFENLRSLPRAYVAREAISESALLRAANVDVDAYRSFVPQALRVLLDQGRIDPARTVLVHDEAGTDPLEELLGAAPREDRRSPPFAALEEVPLPAEPVLPGQARFLVDDPDRIVILTQAEFDGVLVLADAWMPGWEARVDGKPTEIARANIAFRAIRVPAGTHEVEWVYAPGSVRIGARVGIVGLAILFLMLLVQACRRSRPSDLERPPATDHA